MKRKAFIISALIAVLCLGFISDAAAQRWGHYPRGHAYGYWRHRRVWVAPPPPPRPVVIVPPRRYYRHYYRPMPRRYYAPRYYSQGRPYRRW